jgi:hypothetical protein
MSAADHTADLRDLLSAVGMLLLRWGVLERDLKGAAIPEELAGLRQMRNLERYPISLHHILRRRSSLRIRWV